MNKARQSFAVVCVLFLMSTLLLACGNSKEQSSANSTANATGNSSAATAAP
ncbi:hypothetical protein P4H31_07380 [Paenibacillus odorifer]|nr:hypothetical protein [Paenibacillus odorifer]MEC0130845.1 hypothetical protein [Paenibacillus odorifer]MEC0221050.1 hypothetical protein [Paenibacillus odorifer]